MCSMKRGLLIIFAISLMLLIVPKSGRSSPGNEICVYSDVFNVDAINEVHGGYITWVFRGEITNIFRKNVDVYFGNGDGKINISEASAYFLYMERKLLEDVDKHYGYVGTLRITNFDANHGKIQGILADTSDVKGLIGDVNSSQEITIKGRFEGYQIGESVQFLRREAIITPLVASVKENYTMYVEEYGDLFTLIKLSHTETLLPVGTYSWNAPTPPTTFRFVIGTHTRFYDSFAIKLSEEKWPIKSIVKKNEFVFYENPLALFIIMAVLLRVGGYAEDLVYAKYLYWIRPHMKSFKWSCRIAKGLINLFYFVPTVFVIFYINGFIIIFLSALYPALVYIIPTLLFSKKVIPHKTTIDDVYLISSSGILIAHATRRLKPDVDEDILTSMLVAIQNFVEQAFKDEKDVSIKHLEFGDKKIAIKRTGDFYLALVVTGELYDDLEARAEQVVREINEKYGEVMKRWTGNVEDFRGVKEIMEKIWREESTEK